MTDQFGPGINSLSQSFTVPLDAIGNLSFTFDMFINDWTGDYGGTSGFGSMEVLFLSAGGDPVTGAGTIATAFNGDTLVSGGVPNPYVSFSFGISGYTPGATYILDFLETDVAYPMNVGVDNVSILATESGGGVPEPSSIALLLGALAAMGVARRRQLWEVLRAHQGHFLLLVAAFALFSQGAYAQSANVAYPVVAPNSILPGQARPHAWIMSIGDPLATVHGPGDTNCGPGSGQDTCYYLPSDINTAYTTGLIRNGNGGAGMTVGIVDAFYDPQTEANLATFSSKYGLPACTIASGCLTITNQTGGTPSAGFNAGWAEETALDVQWVHAIAPNAKILLVTATDNSFANLGTAVGYAKAHANVVSDSWGSGEFSGETTLDSTFSGGVPILFSSGDTFGAQEYPCASPNVTCVGGTHLLETATSYRNSESVWDDSAYGRGGTSGGCSAYESEPAFQIGFSTCGTKRGMPDVAAIADEYTGVIVFLGSNIVGGSGGYYIFGGTSLACPVTAAVVADIDAARVAAGKAILGGSTSGALSLNTVLYQAAANPFYHYRFYDVTMGTSATAGWDVVTGLGVTLNPALTAFLVGLP
ncbi:MAG TPA: S53 family peptidase [Bryobacteraceae bacterium]|nr:S53 family peptidase [Bryobacteraceae bacterium]